MTDMRAFCFEVETPSEKPRLHPPHHPRWERWLPAAVRKARRRARTERAFEDWQRRVMVWEDNGRPPITTMYYIPAADVTVTDLPDGTQEVSVAAFPSDSKIISTTYPL